jgi:hypothetical protein
MFFQNPYRNGDHRRIGEAGQLTRGRVVSVYLLLFFTMILASPIHIPIFEAASAANPDFSISANPTSVLVNPGPEGNSTITLTSQQGFAGRVNMTITVSPPGIYCQLTEVSLNVTANNSNSTTLHCDGNPGTFVVTVTGTGTIASTPVSRQVNVNYLVADFLISTNPSSISLQTGHEASATVTISSQQAFTQKIYLNLTLPSGIDGAINPSVLSGPGTTTLNVNSTTIGVYNLTIVASSGSVSHKRWIAVAVTSPTPSSPLRGMILGLQPLVFYTAFATAIAIGSAAAVLSLRHRRHGRKRDSSSRLSQSGRRP